MSFLFIFAFLLFFVMAVTDLLLINLCIAETSISNVITKLKSVVTAGEEILNINYQSDQGQDDATRQKRSVR